MSFAKPTRRDCLRWLGAAAAVASTPMRAAATPLDRVRERGALKVGIYHEMPPFHVGGKGIDVDLAQVLAESLGVRLSLLPFHADENMNDDLRSMVWRGHYLGYGPADVLLHVPVDRPLMDANPQVSIFAPYCRDRVVIARRLDQVPRLDTLSQLGDRKVAVPPWYRLLRPIRPDYPPSGRWGRSVRRRRCAVCRSSGRRKRWRSTSGH